MTVNVNSVIPVWVNTWNSSFYQALTSQENWSYVNQGLSWVPFFSGLASALNSYQAFNRQVEISTFFFGAYGYLAFHKIYGTDGSLLTSFNALSIYNLQGLVNASLSRPVNYYNDLVTDPTTGITSSALMAADVATVGGAASSESSLIASLSHAGAPAIQSLQLTLLFKDIKPVGVVNKTLMSALFFTTLNWKQVFNALNVGILTPP